MASASEADETYTSILAEVDVLQTLADELIQKRADCIAAISQFIASISETAAEALVEYRTALMTLSEGQSDVTGGVKASLATYRERLHDAVSQQREQFKSKFETSLQSIHSGVGHFHESIAGGITRADSAIAGALDNGLLVGIENKSNQFHDGLDRLKEAGQGQIGKLTRALHAITDKTRAMADLLDQIKPILEVARTIA